MSTIININGCPRCNGAMIAQVDSDGAYRACLMCGYVTEPNRISLATARAEIEDRPYSAPRSRRRVHAS